MINIDHSKTLGVENNTTILKPHVKNHKLRAHALALQHIVSARDIAHSSGIPLTRTPYIRNTRPTYVAGF